DLKEPYYGRRSRVGSQLYDSIAIPREDKAARYRQFARNYLFYDAPVGLFVSMDRTMGAPQWSDVGGFIQNIMLLARAFGLHGCNLTRIYAVCPHLAIRYRARRCPAGHGRCGRSQGVPVAGGAPHRDRDP